MNFVLKPFLRLFSKMSGIKELPIAWKGIKMIHLRFVREEIVVRWRFGRIGALRQLIATAL